MIPFGEGAKDVFVNLGKGAKRTGKGYMPTYATSIGAENERAAALIVDAVALGSSPTGPLYRLVKIVVEFLADEAYEALSPQRKARLQERLVRAAQRGAAKRAGRKAAKEAIKKVAAIVTNRIITVVLGSKLMQSLVSKLGLSKGGAARGGLVTVLWSLVSMQGVLEQASEARRRLLVTIPTLHNLLVEEELDMAFFLIEPFVPDIVKHLADAMVLLEQD